MKRVRDCDATEAALLAQSERDAPLEPALAQHRDACPRCQALARRLAAWPMHLAQAPFATEDRAPADLLPAVMRRVAAEQARRARRPGNAVHAAIQYATALAGLAACWVVLLEPLARPLVDDYAGRFAPSWSWASVPTIDRSAMALDPSRLADTSLVDPRRLTEVGLTAPGWRLELPVESWRAGLEGVWGPSPTWPAALGLAVALALVSGALVRHDQRRGAGVSRGVAA